MDFRSNPASFGQLGRSQKSYREAADDCQQALRLEAPGNCIGCVKNHGKKNRGTIQRWILIVFHSWDVCNDFMDLADDLQQFVAFCCGSHGHLLRGFTFWNDRFSVAILAYQRVDWCNSPRIFRTFQVGEWLELIRMEALRDGKRKDQLRGNAIVR